MKNQIISFQCVLKNRLGQVLSTSIQGDVLNSVDQEGTLIDFARGLQNVRAGEKRKIAINAERAYGLYDPDLVGELPRSELTAGSQLKVGDHLELFSPEKKCSMDFRVIKSNAETVWVDANHPLAGQDLMFEVEVFSARTVGKDDEGVIALPMTSRAVN